MNKVIAQPGLKFENVLVLTDLSREAASAAPYARAIALKYGSKVHVLHILDPLAFTFGPPEAASRKRQEIWDSAGMQLSRWAAEFLNEIQTDPILVAGEFGQAALQAVRERNIDLLVLGSHGASGLERMFLGSIGEEVFRTVGCPVMTIGPNILSAPEETARFGKVLFATDLTPSSIMAIPYVIWLAENCGSAISVLHLADPTIQAVSERQRTRERIEKELRALLPEKIQSHVEHVIVEFAPAAASVVEFALVNKADVIVLGVKSGGSLTRGATHLPWAVAHQIIADAPCPVLTIRGPGRSAEA